MYFVFFFILLKLWDINYVNFLIFIVRYYFQTIYWIKSVLIRFNLINLFSGSNYFSSRQLWGKALFQILFHFFLFYYERDYSLAVSEDSLSHYKIKRNDIEMM